MRKLFALVGVTGVAAASIAVAPAAQAKTVKACVKKSDGTVRFINKKNKKCKKGWVKSTWNSKGPAGPLGSAGSAGAGGSGRSELDCEGQVRADARHLRRDLLRLPLLPYIFVVLDDGGSVLLPF